MSLADKLSLKHKLGMASEVTVVEYNELMMSPNQALNQDQVQIKRDLSEAYWYRRYNEGRNYNWLSMLPNLLFQLNQMRNPLNPDQLRMNQIYTVHSMFALAGQIFSYKSREHAWLAYPVFMFVGIRNNIRLLDFENTKFLLDKPDEPGRMTYEEWMAFTMSQLNVIGFYTFIAIWNFQNIRGNMIVIVILSLFTMVCGFTAWTVDDLNYNIMVPNGLVTMMLLAFVWFNHGSNNDFITQTEKLVDANSLFKTIFDNLRESVLLV